MILIEFQNSVIYQLYNQETDSIIISINIDINEKKNEIFSEKSSFIKMKNLLADQLFFKLSAAISAEIFPTSDSLAVRITSAKPAPAILCCFSHRTAKAAFKNIDLSVSMNLTFQTVRVTSDSDSQAVRIISLTCRSHNQSQKNEVASIV